MEQIKAVSLVSCKLEDGKKLWYAGVKENNNDLFGYSINWNWYHEEQISNFVDLAQKASGQQQSLQQQTKKRKSGKKRKKSDNQKQQEFPDTDDIKILNGNMLYAINTENPKLDLLTFRQIKASSEQTKQIVKVVDSSNSGGCINWKVKYADSDKTTEISHVELCSKDRDLLFEYCKNNLIS